MPVVIAAIVLYVLVILALAAACKSPSAPTPDREIDLRD